MTRTVGMTTFDADPTPTVPAELKESFSYIPGLQLVDTHTGVALAPQSCDVYVRPDGLIYVSDWNAGLHVLQYEG